MEKIVKLTGKYYVCNRTRILDELMKKGFRPAMERDDEKVPGRKVWLFLNTEEIENAVNKILIDARKRANNQ